MGGSWKRLVSVNQKLRACWLVVARRAAISAIDLKVSNIFLIENKILPAICTNLLF